MPTFRRPNLSILAKAIILTLLIFALAALGIWMFILKPALEQSRYPAGYPYTCDPTLIACGQTEDKGKDFVAMRPEVMQLVQTYGPKGVVIRALEYEDIQDKAFVKRLLGSDYVDVGCIILVDYPGGRFVYLEDDKLDVIRRLDGANFNALLATAPQADVQKFYDNLR